MFEAADCLNYKCLWQCTVYEITIKGMVLYSAVSSPLDRSKRFTLSSPGRPVHSDTVLGFSSHYYYNVSSFI